MTLAEKIIAGRKAKALTQERLAELAGINLRTIQRIEKGGNAPRGFTLKSIAENLGLSLEDLIAADAPATKSGTVSKSNDYAVLQLINISTFAYLIIPFGNILFPWLILRRQSDNAAVYERGTKILSWHIVWTVTLYGLMFLMLALLLLSRYFFAFKMGIGFLLIFFGMYLINIPFIIAASIKIKRGALNLYPTNSII